MKMMVIPIIVEVLRTVSKKLEKRKGELETRGRIDIILTTALQKSVWILRNVLEI